MRRYIFLFFLSLWGIGAIANGVCIDGLYYLLDKKNLTAGLTYKNQVYAHYNKGWEITTANIPETVNYRGKNYRVTSIEMDAFCNCKNLTSVTIPNSVKSIGYNAFGHCHSLSSVTIPNSVKSINSAFGDCPSLTSVTIPNSVKYIGAFAFWGPSSFSLYIDDLAAWCAITYDSRNGRNGCPFSSHSLYLNNELITDLVIPNSVTSIGTYAFINCSSLTSVSIPNGVTSIGDWAFSRCKKLTSVTIPKSVTKIGASAFGDGDVTLYISNSAPIKDYDIREYHPNYHIVRVPDNQLLFYTPFSSYAKDYVTKGINLWRQKEEFERTSDWQKRVTKESQEKKIQSLLSEAEEKYIDFHVSKVSLNLKLGKYDADNEVFSVNDPEYGTVYLAVPYDEAKDFKTNWDEKKTNYKLRILDDKIKLTYLVVKLPNGKTYSYRNTDAVNYNLAEVEYDFEPVEFDLPKTSIPHQNQQNNTIRAGKSAVDTDIPTTNASNPNTFAIIFANEDYKNVASVPFAKNDGAVFQKYCQKTLGIPTTNIHYVENASYNDIRIQLAWLKDVCDAFDGNASVIVYYAGHGIPDEDSKSAYLLPVDGDSRYVQSAYKIDDFYQKLGAMNAKSVTVFVDACFSGSKREQGMLSSARGLALNAKRGVPQGNMVVFSAATGDETAYPDREQQHGMFTYYLLKKLQETKGDISLKDLGDYITTNVRQQSIVKNGKTQTPTVTPSASVGSEWQNWKLK